MIDIVGVGDDLNLADTENFRAANILSVQLGGLEYQPLMGIDLDYFLAEEVQFQTESFKSYCIEVLANFGVNVAQVTQVDNTLFSEFNFELVPKENTTALIAR